MQVLLGDRSTADVVANFVKPETAPYKTDYLTCLLTGKARLDGVDSGGTFTYDMYERDGTAEYWRKAIGERIYGPATYFVSHCWGTKLGELVNMILQHYDELPDTEGGRLYVPVYYWLDIFAVTQHFTGDFKDHPDSDFPEVIRSAPGGVLFTMAPWRNPMSVKRVWCLFEALTALSLGREINLLTDPFDSMAKVDTLLPLFLKQVIGCLDVRKAESTVESDRSYILNLAERQLGLDTFNAKLRSALQHEICEAMILRAVVTGEQEEGRKLLDRGIIISNATLRFWPRRDSAGKETERIKDSGLLLLAEAVKACPNLQSLVVYTGAEPDVTQAGLVAVGRGLAGHPALRHLAIGRLPVSASAPGTGGSLGRASIAAYAALLQSNSLLVNLDLSYNKLGGDGVIVFAQALPGNRTLQVLKLRQVGIDPLALGALADAIQGCDAMRDLDVSFNPDLGDKAAPALLKLLQHKTLLVLRAQCCRLGWQTGKALCGDVLTRNLNLKDLELGAAVQSGIAKQDMSDWNQFCQDTSSPSFLPSLTDGGGGSGGGAPAGLNRRTSMPSMHAPAARGDALAAFAGALRTGFKSLERLDLRGCFLGANLAAEAAGLRDALLSGLTSVRRGAAFGSLRFLDLRSCNQAELLNKIEDSQISLLQKHGGLQLMLKECRRNGIKGGVLRQYVQYDA